jgi:hypothetical protein
MLKKISNLFLHHLPGQGNFQVQQLSRSIKPVEVIIEERDAAIYCEEIIKDGKAALQA